jgi:hypothetical protein
MSEVEEEALYVHFSVMDTNHLIGISVTGLTPDEMSILCEVMHERRDELDEMLAYYEDLKENARKAGKVITLPEAVIAQMRAFLTE